MKKTKLDVETLAVDSFCTAAAKDEGGTVQAYEAPSYPYASCTCTEGGSYAVVLCPPAQTRTTCAV